MDANYTSQYNRSVQGVNDDFAAKRTANTFSRTLAQRRGSRNISDYQRNFRTQLPQYQQNFARRNMADSGVYQKALGRYTGDYSRGLSRMQEDNAAQQYQFDINDATLVAERDRVLQDLALQKAQQIAMTAMHINSLKPYMG